jgi:hypothetical protein
MILGRMHPGAVAGIAGASTATLALASANTGGVVGDTLRGLMSGVETPIMAVVAPVGIGALLAMRRRIDNPQASTLRSALESAAFSGATLLGYAGGKKVDEQLHPSWYENARRTTRAAEQEARQWFANADPDLAGRRSVHVAANRTTGMGMYTRGPFAQIIVGKPRFDDDGNVAEDIVFHEYTHHLLDHYAPGLQGASRGGAAVAESLADTFASLIDADDWTIGEDGQYVLRALDDPRSIEPPGGGEYPTHRSQIDERGVLEFGRTEPHVASTVASHVAYTIAQQIGRADTARLYVHMLKHGDLGSGSDFSALARNVRTAAEELWGKSDERSAAVDAAWARAGYP